MDFSAWNWASNFRLHEAACLIAGVMPVSKKYPTSEDLPPQARPILVKLIAAYYEWILQQHKPERPKSRCLEGQLNIDGSIPLPSLQELPSEIVSRDALRRFLTEIGDMGHKTGYDFAPVNNTTSANRPEESECSAPRSASPDFAMLATRQQLIDAFGTFSGLKANWFRALKDSPALLAARKVKGQGGRGHIAEPLFCPFEVMRWLIHPTRRKGGERRMSESKGWGLLEQHFPKVYAAHSVGDPRDD